MQITTIGLDLAKHVFQGHGVGSDGQVLIRRKLRRAEVVDFLASWRPAWWVWKPVRQPIIGTPIEGAWARCSTAATGICEAVR